MRGWCFILLGILLSCNLVVGLSSDEGCCFLLKDGTNCGVSEQEDCEADSVFAEGSECFETAFCQKGCCYDDELGIYDSNVLEEDCSLASWTDDENCNLPGANLGCCVLGEERTIFETLGQCETDSLEYGSEVDWRSNLNELACLLLVDAQEEGACVFDDGTCRFRNEAWCLENKGEFNVGLLCTSNLLDTSCTMTKQTACVEGKDEVYFMDSCGNVANVYDSAKVDDASYWESVVGRADVCGYNDENGNAESASCGNCNRFDGGACGSAVDDEFDVDVGSFYCRDVSCEFKGERYKNGESWCDYDGAIGQGDDVAGSRHWRYVCSQGEVLLEPCADARKEICVQKDTYEEDGQDVDFRVAECVVNDWARCIGLNEDGAKTDECYGAADCFMKRVKVNNFLLDTCVPEYPRGWDMTNDNAVEAAEDVCALANRKCTMLYTKNYKGDWKCAYNCDCRKQTFTDQMNDLCRSLGDCGGYVNIEGDYTNDGYVVGSRGKKKISDAKISEYEAKSERVEGQAARPDNYSLPNVGQIVELLDIDDYDRMKHGDSSDPAFYSSNFFGYGYPTISHYTGLDTTAMLLDPLGYFLFDWIFGGTKKKRVSFVCEPWSPPVGGDNCESCNGDPMKPCSEYRCHSLGATCELLNEGSTDELCVDGAADDGIPPVVNVDNDAISDGASSEDVSKDGFTLASEGGGCLEAYTPLTFGVSTNKPSICKFDTEMTEFENMSYTLGSSVYSFNHSVLFELPDPSHGQSQGPDWSEALSLYVKCVDYNGHETQDFYTINMCINEADDVGAPRIRKTVPESGTLISFDAESVDVEVMTNELADCRWDISDVEYGSMRNEFACEDELGARSSVYGYVCEGDLPVMETNNAYYIRCMDQPWLDEVSKRNANAESFVLNLKRPEKRIAIEKMAPSNSFESGSSTTSITLKVATIGGGQTHRCSYSFSGYDKMIEMIVTRERGTHEQTLSRGAGVHDIYFECEDETGDMARNSTSFEIIHDSFTPAVSRVWQDGSFVNLVLTESGECRFSFDSCKFAWDDGFDIGSGTEMRFAVVLGEKYFVRCRDEFGNLPNGCSIEVMATS